MNEPWSDEQIKQWVVDVHTRDPGQGVQLMEIMRLLSEMSARDLHLLTECSAEPHKHS